MWLVEAFNNPAGETQAGQSCLEATGDDGFI